MVLSNRSFVFIFLFGKFAFHDHDLLVVTMNHWRWGCLDNLNMRSVIVMPVVWFVVRRSTDDDADKADC
jgi:hypothetical protein